MMNSAKLSKILKALSNQTRLELYLQIARQNETDFDTGCECFITDIVGSLNIGAPTVSHHLKELSNADLISTERRGKFLTAAINKNTIKEAIEILSESIK
jgi:DNA-binding transcriptional ArsR family regulator